jgi:tetratricopeptide (TPR) repeat protein
LDPWRVALCAHYLGVSLYRLGSAKAAYESFSEALHLWQKLQAEPENILTAELNAALGALRAGLLDEAEAGFERLLRSPLAADPGGRAEVLGALALVAARRANRAHAQQMMQASRDCAQESADPGVIVRVTRAAGETFLVLENRDEARQAFATALTLVQQSDATYSGAIAGEDILSVLVGLLDCGEDDPDLAVQALRLVPAALADVNAWWELPRLLAKVAHLGERGLLLRNGSELGGLRDILQRVIEVSSQRPDCREAVERLCHVLLARNAPQASCRC